MAYARYFCSPCEQVFSRKYSLLRHQRGQSCYKSRVSFELSGNQQRLRTSQSTLYDELKFRSLENRYVVTKEIKNHSNEQSIMQFMCDARRQIAALLKLARFDELCFEAGIWLECTFANKSGILKVLQLKTKNISTVACEGKEIVAFINDAIDDISYQVKEITDDTRGFTLHSIDRMLLHFEKLRKFPVLPEVIKNRHAVINPQNDKDCESFKWAVLVPLHTGNHPERMVNLRKIEHHYNFSMIDCPPSVVDIELFESKNNISINLFTLDENNLVIPVKIVSQELADHRDLLVIENDMECEYNKKKVHFYFIKNFSRLVRRQITGRHEHIYVCKQCLSYFFVEKKLTRHQSQCSKFHSNEIYIANNL